MDQTEPSDAAVVVMGDFNDEPFSWSMTDYANSTNSEKVVRSARAACPPPARRSAKREVGKLQRRRVPWLFNLMWPLLAKGEGSYFHGSAPLMFDQFLVSRGLLTGEAGMKINTESAEVVRCPSMLNRNGTPRRFGRPSSAVDASGSSDHLPVGVSLQEGTTR